MKYQDELEAGRRSRKPNMSLMQQVEHHRKKLLAKVGVSIPVSAGEISSLLHVNNKDADQPAHPCSLINPVVIRSLQSIISRLALYKVSIF